MNTPQVRRNTTQALPADWQEMCFGQQCSVTFSYLHSVLYMWRHRDASRQNHIPTGALKLGKFILSCGYFFSNYDPQGPTAQTTGKILVFWAHGEQWRHVARSSYSTFPLSLTPISECLFCTIWFVPPFSLQVLETVVNGIENMGGKCRW